MGLDVGEIRLREHARRCFAAALEAVEPARLVEGALAGEGALDPPDGGRLVVLAIGKAAVPMAAGATSALRAGSFDGVLLAPRGWGGHAPPGFAVFRGAHPLPDQEGVEGARHVREVLRRTGPLDRVLLLLSGGGSALLTLPHGDVSLEDLRRTTGLLLRAGATITELNTVRKHLEGLKGGRMATIAEPSPLTALVLSDVVGDPLEVIGSGPVSPDATTYAEAIAVLDARGLWKDVPERVRRHLVLGREGEIEETPKPADPVFAGVRTRVVGNASLAAEAAAAEAERMGYRAEVGPTTVTGEARDVGGRLAETARTLARRAGGKACVVWAGETTVDVRGTGRGGRCQETALAASLGLEGEEGIIVLAGGTDGVDGPTEAAGAFATGSTAARARGRGLDPVSYLERNDSHAFFAELDDLLETGPTGTNVMDLMIVLTAGGGRGRSTAS